MPGACASAGAVAQYPEAAEKGGLSGPPLMDISTDVLADMYRLTGQGEREVWGGCICTCKRPALCMWWY